MVCSVLASVTYVLFDVGECSIFFIAVCVRIGMLKINESVNWEISIFMYITELPQISTQFTVGWYVCVSGVLKAD